MRLLLFALVAVAAAVHAAESKEACAAMKALLDAKRLERHRLEQSLPIGGQPGEERFFNVDLDGDELSDHVQLSCPGATCLLVAKLSSGRTIEFAAPRLYLVRFRAKVYAVSNVNAGARTIFEFTPAGTRAACTRL